MGDFHGFPPVLIQVGTDEVLLDDSRELAIRMDAQGVDVTSTFMRACGMSGICMTFPRPIWRWTKSIGFVHVTLKIGGLEKRSVHVGGRLPAFQGETLPGAFPGAAQRNVGGDGGVPAALRGKERMGTPLGDVFRAQWNGDGRLLYRFEGRGAVRGSRNKLRRGEPAMEAAPNGWMKLDNSAKIYPAVTSRRWAAVFRVSVNPTVSR